MLSKPLSSAAHGTCWLVSTISSESDSLEGNVNLDSSTRSLLPPILKGLASHPCLGPQRCCFVLIDGTTGCGNRRGDDLVGHPGNVRGCLTIRMRAKHIELAVSNSSAGLTFVLSKSRKR